jgi:hypothetical protein
LLASQHASPPSLTFAWFYRWRWRLFTTKSSLSNIQPYPPFSLFHFNQANNILPHGASQAKQWGVKYDYVELEADKYRGREAQVQEGATFRQWALGRWA